MRIARGSLSHTVDAINAAHFRYPVLALREMDADEARAELKYAAPALERDANRRASNSVYARRRHELAARLLNRL